MMYFRIAGLAAALACATAVPAIAHDTTATRLVECGAQSCLLVTGRRDDATAPVSLNGRAVAVQGGRKWKARVPVATVRAWSLPSARTITVAVDGVVQEARLPVGMLGHSHNLAMLVVRVK